MNNAAAESLPPDPAHASTLLPPPPSTEARLPSMPPADLPRQCRCGAVYTNAEYAALPWRPWPDLELCIAECGCGTTMARPLDVA